MYTVDSLMGFGKYKGIPLKDIPVYYLNWLSGLHNFAVFEESFQRTVLGLIDSKAELIKKNVLPKRPIAFKRPTVRIAEVNIQAECYHQLKLIGIECYLGYKYEHCIFDMVIPDSDSNVMAIVEFKSRKEANKDKVYMTKQLFKYAQYGIPVLYCNHLSQVPDTVSTIIKLIKDQQVTAQDHLKERTKENNK